MLKIGDYNSKILILIFKDIIKLKIKFYFMEMEELLHINVNFVVIMLIELKIACMISWEMLLNKLLIWVRLGKTIERYIQEDSGNFTYNKDYKELEKNHQLLQVNSIIVIIEFEICLLREKIQFKSIFEEKM